MTVHAVDRATAALYVLLLAVAMLLPAAPASAHHGSTTDHHTAKDYYHTNYQSNPYIIFDKGTNTDSEIRAYVSYGASRYRMELHSGSGTGTNECTSDVGWLPNGQYFADFKYKTDGVVVVRGYVWYHGGKTCAGGSTYRYGLFTHSSGIEGTAWNENYTSEGCIKISQQDRYHSSKDSLRPFLRAAYNRDSETLSVRA